MLIIGIDPGITGAAAALDTNYSFADPEYSEVMDTPTEIVKSGRKKKTAYLESAMFQRLADLALNHPDIHVFMEKVGAMPGQGVTSMFNFGMGYGIWKGILAALQWPYTLVTPQAWKKVLMQGIKDKDAARGRACQLFPKMAQELSRKKDIGRADALLIAYYGRRLIDFNNSRGAEKRGG